MIDLHCHLLPGCDDGASNIEVSIEMARLAAADGISELACTPHITPGLYFNDAEGISRGVTDLQAVLDDAGIALKLVVGADVHVAPDLLAKLKAGVVPTIGGTRYFLLEPPHHVVPPRFVPFCRGLLDSGYVPVLTHPERLTWIRSHFDLIEAVNDAGVLMQVTAGSLTGTFGRTALYYAEKFLSERRVDLIASDGHNLGTRPPILSAAYSEVERRLGTDLADELFVVTPSRMLRNEPIDPKGRNVERNAAKMPDVNGKPASIFGRWMRSGRASDHLELN